MMSALFPLINLSRCPEWPSLSPWAQHSPASRMMAPVDTFRNFSFIARGLNVFLPFFCLSELAARAVYRL